MSIASCVVQDASAAVPVPVIVAFTLGVPVAGRGYGPAGCGGVGCRDRSSEIRLGFRRSSIAAAATRARRIIIIHADRTIGRARGASADDDGKGGARVFRSILYRPTTHNGILMNATVLLVCPETFHGTENYNIGLNRTVYRRRRRRRVGAGRRGGLTLFKKPA